MSKRAQPVTRRMLPLLATVWFAQLALLALLQTSVVPHLAFPAAHSIAREAYQSCFMLVLCAAFYLTSYTLLVTWRAARPQSEAALRTPDFNVSSQPGVAA